MKIKLYNAECLEKLKDLEDNSVDSIITDPPAGISFMGKAWDEDRGGRDQWIAWMQEIATECNRVLKAGGHALVWAIPRTSHWTATSWENAGFEVRDIVAHIFGTGFPKSLNIGKAIDKRKGITSEQSQEFANHIKIKRTELKITQSNIDKIICNGTTNYSWFEGRPAGQRLPRLKEYEQIKSLLKLDNRFDEFIGEAERKVIGKKKTNLTVMRNIGGQNISGDIDITAPTTEEAKKWEGWGTALKPAREDWILLRKPLSEKTIASNVLKWGCGGINIDGSRVMTEEDTSKKCTTKGYFGSDKIEQRTNGGHTQGRFPSNVTLDDSDEVLAGFPNTKGKGSKARFFYCAKANKSDRNEGLKGFEEKETKIYNMHEMERTDGTIKELATKKNFHPTVKATKLMQYLVKLITPTNGTCLDPFMGSGSTGKACILEGFGFIGIEREEDYFNIAKARINNVKK